MRNSDGKGSTTPFDRASRDSDDFTGGLKLRLHVEGTNRVVGECAVSLRPLMRDAGAVVRGTYTLGAPGSATAGGGGGASGGAIGGGAGGGGGASNVTLDFACRWVDVNVDASKR